jgi:hypothetical protein
LLPGPGFQLPVQLPTKGLRSPVVVAAWPEKAGATRSTRAAPRKKSGPVVFDLAIVISKKWG